MAGVSAVFLAVPFATGGGLADNFVRAADGAGIGGSARAVQTVGPLSRRLENKSLSGNLNDIFELQARLRTFKGEFPKTGAQVPTSGFSGAKEFADDEILVGEWIDIDKLIPLHPPDTGNLAVEYFERLKQEGFPLGRSIPVERFEDGRFFLKGGHHRLEALRLAGFKRIPVLYNPENLPLPKEIADHFAEKAKQFR
jgi:hypothetical protein